VLSRGLISGHFSPQQAAGETGFRRFSPRFQGENLQKNLALVEQLRVVAKEIGASVAQVAIAWVAAQGQDIIPLIGAKRPAQLAEALGALNLNLSGEQLAALTRAMPKDAVVGGRYIAAQMAQLDSEKR
jgi:aryl-alcohol dehydrogenase-like predicted oxidoreductase